MCIRDRPNHAPELGRSLAFNCSDGSLRACLRARASMASDAHRCVTSAERSGLDDFSWAVSRSFSKRIGGRAGGIHRSFVGRGGLVYTHALETAARGPGTRARQSDYVHHRAAIERLHASPHGGAERGITRAFGGAAGSEGGEFVGYRDSDRHYRWVQHSDTGHGQFGGS